MACEDEAYVFGVSKTKFLNISNNSSRAKDSFHSNCRYNEFHCYVECRYKGVDCTLSFSSLHVEYRKRLRYLMQPLVGNLKYIIIIRF